MCVSLSPSPHGSGFLQFMFKLGFHGKVKPRKIMDTNENTKVGVEVNRNPHNPISLFRKTNHFNKAKQKWRNEKRNKREKQLFSCFCGVERHFIITSLSNYLHNCNVTNFPNWIVYITYSDGQIRKFKKIHKKMISIYLYEIYYYIPNKTSLQVV